MNEIINSINRLCIQDSIFFSFDLTEGILPESTNQLNIEYYQSMWCQTHNQTLLIKTILAVWRCQHTSINASPIGLAAILAIGIMSVSIFKTTVIPNIYLLLFECNWIIKLHFLLYDFDFYGLVQ